MNKVAGARTLKPVAEPQAAPPLPSADWYPQTLDWWQEIWGSPMSAEWDPSDLHGLFILAALVNDFWGADSPAARKEAAVEIRLQRQCFGLTSLDRRRLQWEIDRADQAADRTSARKAAATPAKRRPDPRLKAV